MEQEGKEMTLEEAIRHAEEKAKCGGHANDVCRQVPAEAVLPSASERRNNRRMHRAGIQGGADSGRAVLVRFTRNLYEILQ